MPFRQRTTAGRRPQWTWDERAERPVERSGKPIRPAIVARRSEVWQAAPTLDRGGSPLDIMTYSRRSMSRTVQALIACALVTVAVPARAQSAADSAGIRTAALDYIEGWYAGDGARMERSLHPELAKRNVTTDSASGRSRLIQMSALTLILSTRAGGGSRIPVGARSSAVQILDIQGGAASVRVRASSWVDYMHMARYNGRWVIVNVLWENDAGS
jgi:hypothetical protein